MSPGFFWNSINMPNRNKKEELSSLFLKLIESNISDQELEILETLMADSPEYVKEYCRFAATYSAVQVKFGADISQPEGLDWRLISELAEYEDKAPEVEVEKPIDVQVQTSQLNLENESHRSRFRLLYYSIFSSAAAILFFFIIYANIFPPQLSEPVATLIDQKDVKWDQESEKLFTSDRLLTHQAPFQIYGGILNIVYDNGVEVIIEGPAEFEINRGGIFLNHGKLYSHVLSTGKGFAVDTPNSRFIDLGTEFGVDVDSFGSSELHVLHGEVQLYAGRDGDKRYSEKVYQGSAFRFDAGQGKLDAVPVNNKQFVRFFNSKTNDVWRGEKLNLADLAAGGNGFGTGKPSICIHPLTGRYTKFRDATIEERKSAAALKPVLTSDYIDSIFVPDSNGNDQFVISTSGLTATSFPDTRGMFFAYLKSSPYYPEEKDGYYLDYDPAAENIALYMHSNLGVTFDLEKIRNNFGNEITISKFNFEYGFRNEPGKKNGKVDFWVFVDGKLEFSAENVAHFYVPKAVEISLNNDAEFLSLAVTESDDGGGRDWAAFVNPVLTISK